MDGFQVKIDLFGVQIVDQFNVILVDVKVQNGLFILNGSVANQNFVGFTENSKAPELGNLWHSRLGHIHRAHINELRGGVKVRDYPNIQHDGNCFVCTKAKIHKSPLTSRHVTQTNLILDLLHTDICGPFPIPSLGGSLYFLTIIDDYSKYLTVYNLCLKSDASSKIQEFVQKCKTFFGRVSKMIRSDNGGEFVSNELNEFLKLNGIQRQFTTTYTPQQNAVVERMNKTIVEMVRCLIHEKKLPLNYWGEAVQAASYIRNRLPRQKSRKSPYELWIGKVTSVKHFRIFGSMAIVYDPHYKRNIQLNEKGIEHVFVGYSQQSQTYRFINPITNKIISNRDAIFFENKSYNFDAKTNINLHNTHKDNARNDTNNVLVQFIHSYRTDNTPITNSHMLSLPISVIENDTTMIGQHGWTTMEQHEKNKIIAPSQSDDKKHNEELQDLDKTTIKTNIIENENQNTNTHDDDDNENNNVNKIQNSKFK